MPSANHGNRFQRLLASLNCDGRRGAALLVVCAVLLATALAGDAARELLRYQRDGLAAGQWWRLATAHVVHLGMEHALVNTLGLMLMWALFARDYPARGWVAILLGAMAAIDVGLWFGDSTVLWYVGSSGVLHGIMAAGTLAHLRRGEADGALLAVLLVGKLLYEQAVGALPLTSGTVIVDAHLYGALGGLAAAHVAARLWPDRLARPL